MILVALFLLAAAPNVEAVAGPDVTPEEARLFGDLVASQIAHKNVAGVVHVELGRLGATYVANLRLGDARASATGPTMDAVVAALPAAIAELTGPHADPDIAVVGAVTAVVGVIASVGFYGGGFVLATLSGAPPSVTDKLLVP